MNLTTPQNKVFGSSDLRKHILNYILPKRCFSCKQILKFNNIEKFKHYKDYNNYSWRYNQNRYFLDTCNWCYYYVYEYP